MSDSRPLRVVPTVDGARLRADEAAAIFSRTNLLLIKRAFDPSAARGLRELSAVHADAPSLVARTWCVENAGDGGDAAALTPRALLGGGRQSVKAAARAPSWYVSFVLQNDEKLLARTLARLPLAAPPCFAGAASTTARCVWFFVGRHAPPAPAPPLRGRPEHTDAVSHAGTWHAQLEGKKVWHVRPLADARAWPPRARPPPTLGGAALAGLRVECAAGDVLLINTRCWWHRTEIPPTGDDGLSISYARDWTGWPDARDGDADGERGGGDDKDGEDDGDDGECAMGNVDGVYASRSLKAGDVVLTEDELPDCALPEHASPNCEVVSDCEAAGGAAALVATRDIGVGEWLTVGFSEDEESGEEEDEDEEEEDDDDEEEEEVCEPCEPPAKRRR